MAEHTFTLQQLLQEIPDAQIIGDADACVQFLAYDSRQVSPGAAFVCIRGLVHDGHQFIAVAIERGAHVIIADNKEAIRDLPNNVTGVIVPDTRLALALGACAFYGHPSRRILLVGITGTNGKTTVAHLVAHLLKDAGYSNVGIIGTLGAATDKKRYDTGRTTPESLDLQRLLAEFVDDGSDAIVMEVSSHALAMGRVAGCAFDAGIFTNLTQDHLDFHETMEKYFYAKALLFDKIAKESAPYKTFHAITNADDNYGKRLQHEILQNTSCLTYGIENAADIKADALHLSPLGSSFTVQRAQEKVLFRTTLTGRFNVYNMLAAIAFGVAQQMPLSHIQSALQRVSAPEGRMEIIDCGQDFHVGVDYAHTPDGLEKVLSALQEFAPCRVITVFGCGGDRDRTKRPQMGAIAARFSDICVVTSDNPRSENPADIIAEILVGVRQENTEYLVEIDRRQAIEKALSLASTGDFVLIAGKGHETYQIFRDETIHFDDREVARAYLGGTHKKSSLSKGNLGGF